MCGLLFKGLRTDRPNAGDEVFCFAEAGAGDTSMLVVGYCDVLADHLFKALRYGGIPYCKGKDLRGHARESGHGQFTLPGFANPAPPGELLYEARPFAGRIYEVECCPGVKGEQNGRKDPDQQNQLELPAVLSRCGRRREFVNAAHRFDFECRQR